MEIKLAELSPEMEEAVLVAWRKNAGDAVAKGDILYEVETDKVVTEVEADFTGKLTETCVEEGDRVSVGEVLARANCDD